MAQILGANDIPKITEEAILALRTLPVRIHSRKEAWRYLGFKHVNGLAKWGSYAKSRYIADVHREFGVSLDDIAKQIGDTHRTVLRLYRGLMVIEQAERLRVFDRDDRWTTHFSFSHLYVGLDYDGISEFLSLAVEDDEGGDPVPQEKVDHLGEICAWLYGSKKDKIPPVIESQNPDLKNLNIVLKSREGITALRAENSLSQALELSRPSSTLFEENLLSAKRSLQKARANMTTGYDGSEDLLRIAGSVANMADDLYQEMDRKAKPGKKQRLSEE